MGFTSFVGGLVAKWLSLFRRPVSAGEYTLAGIEEDVRVSVDEFGVPHIVANSLLDALRALGWIHAKERLFQMELLRRVCCGRVSEFAGEEALPTDRIALVFGFRRIAEEDATNLEEDVRAQLEAYLDGVNGFISDRHAYKKPVEFTLAEIEVAPFAIVDILAFMRLIAFQMSYGWYEPLLRKLILDQAGPLRARELDLVYPREIPSILPSGDIEVNWEALTAIRNGQGSNSFVVSGQHTDTGLPYLESDPHLMLTLPSIWFEAHIRVPSEEIDCAGVGFPMWPGLIIGHNQSAAWGITLSFSDISDIYVIKKPSPNAKSYIFDGEEIPMTIIEEEIHVKGKDQPEKLTVHLTHHGPIIDEVIRPRVPNEFSFALRAVFLMTPSSAHAAAQRAPGGEDLEYAPLTDFNGNYVGAAMRMWKIRNVEEFLELGRSLHIYTLNITYADSSGNIAYHMTGAVPMGRNRRENLPLDGSLKENEWYGFVPFDKLPHTVNPEKGYIVSANHRVVNYHKYPYWLGNIFLNGYRAARIASLLDQRISSGQPITQEYMKESAVDVYSIPSQRLINLLRKFKFDDDEGALSLVWTKLMNFDGFVLKESSDAAVYEVFRYRLERNIWEPILGRSLVDKLLGRQVFPLLKEDSGYYGNDFSILYQILSDPETSFYKGDEGLMKIVRKSLQETYEFFRSRFGRNSAKWTWGSLHTVTLAHAMGEKVSTFNRGPYPVDGDGDTVNNFITDDVRQYKAGVFVPSWRQVIDLSDFSNSVCVLPGGQSGHRGTTHYDDQIQMWLPNQWRPLLWNDSDIEASQRSTLLFLRDLHSAPSSSSSG